MTRPAIRPALGGSIAWDDLPPQGSPGFCQFEGQLHCRAELASSLGVDATEATDAQLIERIYSSRGIAGLAKLVGDWSLALWDGARRTLILASDFCGSRPLYYTHSAHRTVWSDSLAQFASPRISPEFVADFLTFSGSADATPYRGVHVVAGGMAIRIANGAAVPHGLWQPQLDSPLVFRDPADYAAQLQHLFRESVQQRISRADRVLCELSGGLDSTSVYCMAQEERPAGCSISSLSYISDDSTDKRYIRAVQKRFSAAADPLEIKIEPGSFVSERACGAFRPAWWHSRHLAVRDLAASGGITTIMTGQMGDLVMCNWHDDSEQAADLFRRHRYFAGIRECFAWSRALSTPIYATALSAMSQAFGWFDAGPRAQARWTESQSKSTRELALERALRRSRSAFDSRSLPPSRRKRVAAVLNLATMRWLESPEPLREISFTHPFSHRPLVEFMLRIPASETCRPGEPRKLMRHALRSCLPGSVAKRRNKASYRADCVSDLLPLARLLSDSASAILLADLGFVDADRFKARLSRLAGGFECDEAQLRQIVLLEFWLRSRVNQGAAARA